ncbi:hypothetical protein O7602_18710 [Micromonospora sp. WMMD1128]|uniref:hypothetical protein n=1 Tax=Micromonospora sp. WMMD1128 TaxID=3015150 RepID=UPI00248C7FAD|nr:hypothetical protein [Micromonospora sp. WMMD1128]WBB71766.1 hypothetical protein O7602_18710 [Micromonospora sp. WMMD1128]
MDMVTTSERPPSAPEPADPPAPGGPAARIRAAVRYALPALVGWTVVRLLGLLSIWLWARSTGRGTVGELTRSDGVWYLGIARDGYDGAAQLHSNMAFFPLYPGLTAGLDTVTPFDLRHTALLVSWVAGFAAAWGLFAVGAHVYDRRVGVVLAVLWGVLPHAAVQLMSYSEGLFTALAAWSLYALLRRHWLTAGALCLLAGLTRPTGSSLIGVVGLAALIAVIRRRDGWRPWAAMLLAPAGWLGYLAWVGWRTGRPDGWFRIQGEGWGSSFDLGVNTVQRAREVLSKPSELEFYVVTLVAVLAIMLFVLSLLDRQPWQLLLYSGLLLLTTLGAAGFYHSKARFLLPAFPLLLPAAVALARAGRARAATVLTTLALVSAYFGGYLLLVWRFSP